MKTAAEMMFCVLVGLSLVLLGSLLYNDITFGINCAGNLKRASIANNVTIAEKELTTALDYLKAHGMTEGYTSVIYQTPSEDVTFWYENLRASRDELRELKAKPELTSMEQSNTLLKLRESLMRHGGESGDVLILPNGIENFPYNKRYAGGFLLIMIAIALCGLVIGAENDRGARTSRSYIQRFS